MKPNSIPEVIQTPRLILRPFRHADLEDVLDYSADEEWSRFLPVPFPYEREHAADFIARQTSLDRTVRPAWALVFEGVVIGGLNLALIAEHRLAELGFSVARRHWGRGLVPEAGRAVIDAAFEVDPELNRMRALADERNVASKRVLEKLGMRKEGVLRQNRINRGEFCDEAWFGILRSEWVEQQARS